MQTSNDPNPSSPGTEQENFRFTTCTCGEEPPALAAFQFLVGGSTGEGGPFGSF